MKRLALLGLAFLLALAVPTLSACQESHESPSLASQPDYGDGYHDGYDEGYKQGEDAGYEKGYLEGKAEGEQLGREQGYQRGYDAGYATGWSYGFSLGEDVENDEARQASSEESATTEPTEYLYVGSINSNVYHYPSCRYVAQIYPQNRIWFTSAEDARSQGYRPCKVCKPPG